MTLIRNKYMTSVGKEESGVSNTCIMLTNMSSVYALTIPPDNIMKTRLYNFDPLKPHFYIVKLGFIHGYTLFFLFLLKNIDFGYLLELPCWDSSNEYPQSMFWKEIWKISDFFIFLVVKFSVYLNRHVFLMNPTFQPEELVFFFWNPSWGISNEYLQQIFLWRNKKKRNI